MASQVTKLENAFRIECFVNVQELADGTGNRSSSSEVTILGVNITLTLVGNDHPMAQTPNAIYAVIDLEVGCDKSAAGAAVIEAAPTEILLNFAVMQWPRDKILHRVTLSREDPQSVFFYADDVGRRRNGVLSVVFTVRDVTESSFHGHDSKLPMRYLPNAIKLYETGTLSDVTMLVQETTDSQIEKFRVHSQILYGRTPVFDKLLCPSWSSNPALPQKEILVSEANPELFGAIMRYMYSGEFPVFSDNCEMSEPSAKRQCAPQQQRLSYEVDWWAGLLLLADRFNIGLLVSHIEKWFLAHTDISTVCKILEVTDHVPHVSHPLFSYARRFALVNIRRLVETEEFKALDPSIIKSVLLAGYACCRSER